MSASRRYWRKVALVAGVGALAGAALVGFDTAATLYAMEREDPISWCDRGAERTEREGLGYRCWYDAPDGTAVRGERVSPLAMSRGNWVALGAIAALGVLVAVAKRPTGSPQPPSSRAATEV